MPAGATKITGTFERGDVIEICNAKGQLLARGLSGYSAAEAQMLMGQKSANFEAIIGYDGRAELVHADDLVLIT